MASEHRAGMLDSARAVLSSTARVAGARQPGPLRADPDWRRLAEWGWFGVGLDAAAGGAGGGASDEVLLQVEAARHLASGPLLATTLAAHVALAAGRGDLVTGLLEGSRVAGLLQPEGPSAQLGNTAVSGHFRCLDCQGADMLLVLSRHGAALLDCADVSMPEPLPCIDPASSLHVVDLPPVHPMARTDSTDIFARGLLLAAAGCVGVAQAALDDAVAHATTRIQFGRPIGAFQAIKHRCAEMAVRHEAARALTSLAAAEFGSGSGPRWAIASAKAIAADAALRNAGDNVQIHGASGFSQDTRAHLFVKRAWLLEHTVASTPDSLGAVLAEPGAPSPSTPDEV
ncbi:MAG TPA: acyl-CoA dehydrogenase [Candidatus Dormibacteraeota bacterium]|jgi:alkylation response protein AidB-like acyl-CoA dehydrogenase|nr:acyl-CoA dehydrogenase [Candidatus Dormibacteraeota bacterium]